MEMDVRSTRRIHKKSSDQTPWLCSIDDVLVFVSPGTFNPVRPGHKHFNVCSTAMKRAPKTQPPAIETLVP
uniref:WGS project CBME000000000 data, contig CS3487_c000168 n=1 Tax=Fusarium pseudograminearum CS3487 TaxID=1318458 RepID=A0A096PD59_FUSPS|nr:unnamed protein product [Fusarium pseudograminearum CS3487]